MANRIFYGEYTLAHWIELMLNKQIILPEYQRTFVWEEGDVKRFIDSLTKDYYIPPVTIGAYKDGSINKNLILDGQQRLTSILLAYLSLYPNRDVFRDKRSKFADANDGDEDEEIDDGSEMINWTMSQLLEHGSSKEQIRGSVSSEKYKNVNYMVQDTFFREKYLGFSYIVQHGADSVQQKEYYSQVFRNINIRGVGLDPIESREALYFLDTTLIGLFKPDLVREIKIKANKKVTQLDFVRILSLMSQYCLNGCSNKIARGYKTHMEDYYEEYLIATVNDAESSIFKKFSDIFPDKNFTENLTKLCQISEQIGIVSKDYPSIIDADVEWFGLVYWVLYNGKNLDTGRIEELKKCINDNIISLKETSAHKRTPGALKYLRLRISTSVELYKEFCV